MCSVRSVKVKSISVYLACLLACNIKLTTQCGTSYARYEPRHRYSQQQRQAISSCMLPFQSCILPYGVCVCVHLNVSAHQALRLALSLRLTPAYLTALFIVRTQPLGPRWRRLHQRRRSCHSVRGAGHCFRAASRGCRAGPRRGSRAGVRRWGRAEAAGRSSQQGAQQGQLSRVPAIQQPGTVPTDITLKCSCCSFLLQTYS